MAEPRNLDEARFLRDSQLLREVVERIRKRALEDLLRGPGKDQPVTEAWLREKRDFARAIDAVLPAIETMIAEIEGEQAGARITDTA